MSKNEKASGKANKSNVADGIKFSISGSSAHASQSDDTSSDNENARLVTITEMKKPSKIESTTSIKLPPPPLSDKNNNSLSSASTKNFMTTSHSAATITSPPTIIKSSSHTPLDTTGKQDQRRRSIFDYLNEADEDEPFDSKHGGVNRLLMPTNLTHIHHQQQQLRQILSADNVRSSNYVPLVQVSFPSDDQIEYGICLKIVLLILK
jgi:hypothetical protein